MRFILYVSILIAVLPFVFTRPFFGLCVYYVVSLLQPKLLCWRADFQDALLVGVPLVMGAVAFGVRRVLTLPQFSQRTGKVIGIVRRLVRSSLFEPSWQIVIFALLIGYVILNRIISPFPMSSTTYQFRNLCKVILVTVLLTGLASDFRRFRIIFIVVALSTAFWAIKGGVKVILLGPHQVYGKSYDNNLFALTSVMALPMVFYYGLSVRHARWRTLLLVCSALICLAVIGSRSRAGFVALAVVAVCMAWASRHRVKAALAVVMLGGVTLFMSGGEIRERINSIIEYREDRSARSRFVTWETAQEALRQNPIFGIGFNQFEAARERYEGGRRAAHNIFFQNAAELGLVGHPIWLAVVVGTLISLYRFMRWSTRLPPQMRWAYHWSRGLLVGMLAFCVHGFFHNEEYLELMFTIAGLNVALQVMTRRELRTARLETLAAEAGRPRAKAHRRRRFGLAAPA